MRKPSLFCHILRVLHIHMCYICWFNAQLAPPENKSLLKPCEKEPFLSAQCLRFGDRLIETNVETTATKSKLILSQNWHGWAFLKMSSQLSIKYFVNKVTVVAKCKTAIFDLERTMLSILLLLQLGLKKNNPKNELSRLLPFLKLAKG